jgi:hypothetical protein
MEYLQDVSVTWGQASQHGYLASMLVLYGLLQLPCTGQALLPAPVRMQLTYSILPCMIGLRPVILV